VHPDKNHLEAADKIARHQQLKAAVLKRFAQRLHDRLLAKMPGPAPEVRLAQTPCQRHDQQCRQRQRQQCLLPAQKVNQETFGGHHQELAE